MHDITQRITPNLWFDTQAEDAARDAGDAQDEETGHRRVAERLRGAGGRVFAGHWS